MAATGYAEFLAAKNKLTPDAGFNVPESKLNISLFPFQRSIVRWAICRGRAALFLDTGLGKTLCQLEWASKIIQKTGKRILIVAPLAVGPQTIREAEKFKITKDVSVGTWGIDETDIQITNYERLHKIDPTEFVGVVLDESSILKSIAGKQRTRILDMFSQTPYRLACTATPAPNDTMELGNHAEFVGVMSRSEMLSMYFIHDGGETSKWRLKGHGQQEFWDWMAKWSVMIRKPSDIGFDDAGFVLPELSIHQHVVEFDSVSPGHLFKTEARGLSEQRQVRRDTIGDRTKKITDLIGGTNSRKWIVWCNLNAEQDAIAAMLRDECVSIQGSTPDDRKIELEARWREGDVSVLISKPKIFGFGMNWQHCNNVAFSGLSHSYEQFYQAIRRCWRFGQKEPVDVHVVISDRDSLIVNNIKRKESEMQRMANGMVQAMSNASRKNIEGLKRDEVEYNPMIEMEIPLWLRK